MTRDDFKIGDRVLALLSWGRIVGRNDDESDFFLVHTEDGFLRYYPWWEMYHERDVEVRA